jgi:glycosyltransferase involved in cell wall biosynthesis
LSKPRVLFVSRTTYRLPLDAPLARKWDALADELDLRVLAAGRGGDARFRLVPARTPAFYLTLPRHVAHELRSFRPDVVVAQSPYEASAAIAGGRLAGLPVRLLVEVHGDWRTAARLYGSPLRRVAEPVSLAAARLAVRRADAIRTVSPFTSSLVRSLGREPTATFTTYFDESAFDAEPPVDLPPTPRVLFVGVLERYKNVSGLADAWRLAAARVPDAILHLVGRGRERRIVEELLIDLPGQTRWDEQLAPAQVAAALDDATLIVEDGESGLVVPPGDTPALAEALVRLLSDRVLAERLASGARAAAGGWSQTPELFARRMRELVDTVRR